MGSISSKVFRLVGNNSIWINLYWKETMSGNQNIVEFTMKAATKYRISGSWPCRLIIDGENFGAPRMPIKHGGSGYGGETTVRSGIKKTFTYTGSKSIKVFAAIENMDYYDVSQGPSSSEFFYPTLDATISLSNNNAPPSVPRIICNNTGVNGNYLAENTLDVELSQVSDPDGDTVRYVIYGECKRPGYSYWEKIGDSNSCILWGTNRSVSYNVTGYPRGTQFRVWGKTEDTHGASAGSTGTISNIYRNHMPNQVSGFSPYEGYFNSNNFTISWSNPGDPNGNTPSFNLWRSINNGSYEKVLSNSYATSYTQDMSGHSEGTRYNFKISTYDGLTEGRETYSGTYIKNSKPTTPTQIFPNSGFYLGETLLTWNKSIDPEGRGIDRYEVYINNVKIGSSQSNSFKWTIPYSDPDEKEYTVSVEAVDVDNKLGDRGYATGPFKKAKPPEPPTWIKPEETYFENEIPLTWESISSNGYNVKYQIEFRVNDNPWIILEERRGTPRYTHDISNIARGSRIQYRIAAVNSFEQASTYAYSKDYYRNRIPLKPTIMYPLSNSTIYDLTPRIAFIVESEPDNQGQTIYVECGGKTYNSIDHKEMFSRRNGTFAAKENIVFTCSQLTSGLNKISIYVNDGLIDSPKEEREINIIDSDITAKANELITAELHNTMRNKINFLRVAYGLDEYMFPAIITKNGVIKFEYIKEMREAILEVREAINNFDKSNVDKIPTSFSEATRGSIIYANIVQEIIDIIKNT